MTQGRNPLDRITARPAPASEAAEPRDDGTTGRPDNASPDSPAGGAGRGYGQQGSAPPGGNAEANDTPVTGNDEQAANPPGAAPGTSGGSLAGRDNEEDELSESMWRGRAPGDPVPLPALVNLLVPAGTLLGWGTAPRPGRRLGPPGRRRNPGLGPGRLPAPWDPLVHDHHRPLLHRLNITLEL